MSTDQKIIKNKLELLKLARALEISQRHVVDYFLLSAYNSYYDDERNFDGLT